MSTFDQQNEVVLKKLPVQSLSYDADKRIKRQLNARAVQLGYKSNPWVFLQRLVAVPVAFAVLLTSVAGYAYGADSVVTGDALFTAKAMVEEFLYPDKGDAQERIAYHLWLSDRRYAEVFELLKRRSFAGNGAVTFIPAAEAAPPSPNPLKGEPEVAPDLRSSRATVGRSRFYSKNSALDLALQLTLRSAHRNTEAAVEISTEISDVRVLKAVHLDIQRTVVRQKIILEEIAPVLEAIEIAEENRTGEPLVSSPGVSGEASEADTLFEVSPRDPVPVSPRTLKDLVLRETDKQEALLERLSRTVSNAERDGKGTVNILHLIPEEGRVLQKAPSSADSKVVPDRFERVIEEANRSHQQAKRKFEEEYEFLFAPVGGDLNRDLEEKSREPRADENLNRDLQDSRIPVMEEENKESVEEIEMDYDERKYEPVIPSRPTTEAISNEEKERELLEKEIEQYRKFVPPSVPPPAVKPDYRYEAPLKKPGEDLKTPIDTELQKERGLLERE
jgi:hypothetical protein